MSKIPFIIYFISHFLYRYKIPFVPTLLMYVNRIMWGAYIPPSAKLGRNCKFGYGGSAVVIHGRAVIGENCSIGPAVTIGGRSKKYEVPIIGRDVYIGGGAKILGDVTIGDNVVIGANAVVVNDIPSGCIVVGIPGKIIKQNIKMKDYV